MNSRNIDWSAYIDSMTALHQLHLDADRKAEVMRQMARIETMAQRFVDFPLEAEIELAPVFRP